MDISAPLKPAVLHILMALAEHDLHGYGVMQTVREQSQGRVPLRTGSFYRHLAQLIDEGLVEEAPGRGTRDDPRRGAQYRLTLRGRRVLEDERRRLQELLDAFPRARAARKGHA